MLAEIESGLVESIRASDLGKHLRQVATLPDLSGDSLIGRFSTDAPAAYVSLGSSPVKSSRLTLRCGVALVSRNSGSQRAARHGDGVAIGLLPMIDAALGLLDGMIVIYDDGESAVSFEVTSYDLINSDDLYQRGVHVGVIQIESSAELWIPHRIGALSDFKTFNADYDLKPFESAAEHDKWLKEPPDHETSAPDVSDKLNLRE
jgi:hypothetical protein